MSCTDGDVKPFGKRGGENRSCGESEKSQWNDGTKGSVTNADPQLDDLSVADVEDDGADVGDDGAMTNITALTHIIGDSKKCRHTGVLYWADEEISDTNPLWGDDYTPQFPTGHTAVAAYNAADNCHGQAGNAAVATNNDEEDHDVGREAAVAEEKVIPSNIGFTFGNWGKKSKDIDLQERIDLQIKRSPAHILGLCEAQSYHAEILRAPATKGHPGAQMNKWIVCRGTDDEAPLIAARDTVGANVEMVWHEKQIRRPIRKQGKNCQAYTRLYAATSPWNSPHRSWVRKSELWSSICTRTS